MKLFLVSRIDEVHYDEYDAFVIRAKDPGTALAMAQDRQSGSWQVTELFREGTLEIILGSFNAG